MENPVVSIGSHLESTSPVNATKFEMWWGDVITCLYLHLNGQYHMLTADGGLVPLTFIPASQNPTGQDVLAFPVGIGAAPSVASGT